MKSTLTCGLFGFVIFLPLMAFTQTSKYQKALQHYQLGRQYYQEGKTEAAMEQFRQALKFDRKFAAAHNQLAVIYMNQGTVYGRMQAEGELKAALQLEPRNIEYNLNLGFLLLKKGLTGAAETQFQKIIKLDPQNSQAYLQLGRIKDDQWRRYRDMVSPQSEGVVFRFDHFAKKDYWKALYYYSKAIASDPRLTEAYYRLSLMYFEQDSLAEMARLLEQAVIINPEDKNCHLFLGLCYHKLGHTDQAMAQYLQARALMPEDERAIFDSIEMIMSPEEAEQYRKAEASQKEHLERLFWKRRDPLFLTESNERVLEHYSRVAYANLRYGNPDKALEGWKSDRGKVYIRYGKPLELVRTRPSLEAPSKEVWLYSGFNFIFEDRFLSENYTFQWGDYFEADYLDRYKKMIKRTPEIYEPDFGGKPFSIPYILATFRGEDKTVVDIFYGIPAEGVYLSYHGDSTRLWVDQGLFLFNDDWQEVAQYVEPRDLVVAERIDSIRNIYFIDRKRLAVPPGTYHLALEYKDKRSPRAGAVRDTIAIASYSYEELQMSDIVLASKIEPDTKLKALAIGELGIIPNLWRTFQNIQPIYVYYEIYNLQKDATGETRFQIDTIIRTVGPEKPGLAKMIAGLGDLLGVYERKQEEVRTSYVYTGNSDTEKLYKYLHLGGIRTGRFALTLNVTDMNSGQKTQKSVEFELIKK